MTDKDFINEQPSLHGKSHTCVWCGDIFQTDDPCKAHPTCPLKESISEQV